MVSSKYYIVINIIKDSKDDPLWIWAYVIMVFASEGGKRGSRYFLMYRDKPLLLFIGRMRESIIRFKVLENNITSTEAFPPLFSSVS